MDNEVWAPIRYRDFWDVPRIFLVSHNDQDYLFDCPFDEATEDYPDVYHVYVMPSLSDEDLAESWAELPLKARKHLADVPISNVRFDSTRRQAIDPTIIGEVTARIRVPT